MNMQSLPAGAEKMNGRYRYAFFYIAVLVLFSGIFIVVRLSKVDNVPYTKTLEEGAYTAEEFHSENTGLCSVSDTALTVAEGEGEKLFSSRVSLEEGDAFIVTGEIENLSEEGVEVSVDLFDEDFDQGYNRFTIQAGPGESTFSGRLPYYRSRHPEECFLRVYSNSTVPFSVQNLSVDRMSEVRGGNGTVRVCVIIFLILAAAAGMYLIFRAVKSVVFLVRQGAEGRNETRSEAGAEDRNDSRINGGSEQRRFSGVRSDGNHGRTVRSYSENRIWTVLFFAGIVLLVSVILVYLYHAVNLSHPLWYSGGDEMGVYYFVKTIKENGLSFYNPMAGGISGADLFDYPCSDGLSFILVKIISLFVSDTYLITNLFYFLSFYLIALTSACVCRKLGLGRSVSIMVSVLYAFSPFIQTRYAHMWLVPYFMLPIACLIAVDVIEGRVIPQGTSAIRARGFWRYAALSFLCAFTGLYYAFFACALFAVAFVVRNIRAGERHARWELYPIAFIGSTFIGVMVNVLPNMVYWVVNGYNTSSQLTARAPSDAETYALKMAQILLPRAGHRIGVLAKITEFYNQNYPLVNENYTSSMGLIASIGFILCILILFRKSEFCKSYAFLSISTFLIATLGGLSALISVFVRLPVRCYNRMSLVIMFLGLVTVGEILNRWLQKKHLALGVVLCMALIVVGIYDQTLVQSPNESAAFLNKRSMMGQIQDTLEEGDMVFMLPYTNWVSGTGYRQHTGYIETDGIRWSYGAMEGREEALWQQAVADYPTAKMIRTLRRAGYDGLYLDRDLYVALYGEEALEARKREITEVTGREPLACEDGTAFFWDIRK